MSVNVVAVQAHVADLADVDLVLGGLELLKVTPGLLALVVVGFGGVVCSG